MRDWGGIQRHNVDTKFRGNLSIGVKVEKRFTHSLFLRKENRLRRNFSLDNSHGKAYATGSLIVKEAKYNRS